MGVGQRNAFFEFGGSGHGNPVVLRILIGDTIQRRKSIFKSHFEKLLQTVQRLGPVLGMNTLGHVGKRVDESDGFLTCFGVR